MIFCAALATAFVACTSEQEEAVLPQPTEVRMTFSPYDMTPMRAATRAAVADFATRLDIWLYSEGTEAAAIHQTSDDEDFASLSVTLDKTKTYQLYAVAHRCSAAATLTDGVIAFPQDKVTHSFYYTQQFTPSQTTSLSCQMERIVGMFRLETTDVVPTDVTRFTFALGGSPLRWSTATGATYEAERTVTYNSFSKNQDGSVTLSAYIIASAANTTDYDITVTAYDAEQNVIKSRTFEDVPIRNGYRSTYRGAFFTDQQFTASFTATDWQDYETVDF